MRFYALIAVVLLSGAAVLIGIFGASARTFVEIGLLALLVAPEVIRRTPRLYLAWHRLLFTIRNTPATWDVHVQFRQAAARNLPAVVEGLVRWAGHDATIMASEGGRYVLKGDIPFPQPTTIYCGMEPIEAARLRAGVDYPADLSEFDRFFPREDACLRFLERLRWPTGFVCPKCGVAAEAWRMSRGLFLCTSCRAQTSVTAGTIFEGTRKPLKLWFIAAWEITGHKYGANALNVKRMLGVKSYKTAWSWLHKFRRAMVRPGRDRLSGVVEVDETYVGGEERGGKGRFTEKKAIVAVAVELKEHGYGRIRLRRIPNVKTATLEQFVTEMIEPGAVVHTDAWTGYRNLEKLGYSHRVTNQSKSEDPAHVLMPGVHRAASLLKRWLLGTFQGSVSNAHLNYYLDEFTFRFNRRSSTSRGLLFFRLLEQAAQTAHTSTSTLFHSTGRGPARIPTSP